jgi:hypothetical protein
MAKTNRLSNKEIHVFMTEGEYDVLKKRADSCGVSMSNFIRRLITEGKIIHIVVNEDLQRDLIYEINRIGNNINQIAVTVNMTKTVDQNDFDRLFNEWSELFRIVAERTMA